MCISICYQPPLRPTFSSFQCRLFSFHTMCIAQRHYTTRPANNSHLERPLDHLARAEPHVVVAVPIAPLCWANLALQLKGPRRCFTPLQAILDKPPASVYDLRTRFHVDDLPSRQLVALELDVLRLQPHFFPTNCSCDHHLCSWSVHWYWSKTAIKYMFFLIFSQLLIKNSSKVNDFLDIFIFFYQKQQ